MTQQYFTRRTLNGTNYGTGVLLYGPVTTPTTSAATTKIHGVGETEFDELWLYAANQSTAAANLYLYWAQTAPGAATPNGASTVPSAGGSLIQYTIAAGSGLTLVVPGLILGNGVYLNGAASTAGSIVIYGFANHIGPSL